MTKKRKKSTQHSDDDSSEADMSEADIVYIESDDDFSDVDPTTFLLS